MCCRFTFQQRRLLEGVFGKSLSANLEVVHVGRNVATEVFVHIELGKILSQHEAVSAQTGAETHFGVDNVAGFGVASRPHGQETHLAQVGNPLGKDLRDNLEELLAVVFDVLARLVGIGVGAGAAYYLACMSPLLAVDS